MGDLQKANSAGFRGAWRICCIYHPDYTNLTYRQHYMKYIHILYTGTLMFIPLWSANELVCKTTFWRNETGNDRNDFPASWGERWIETDRSYYSTPMPMLLDNLRGCWSWIVAWRSGQNVNPQGDWCLETGYFDLFCWWCFLYFLLWGSSPFGKNMSNFSPLSYANR